MQREDRQAWLSHPCTQELIQNLSIAREDIKETWSTGDYPTPEQNAEMVGQCKAIAVAIELVEETGGKDE
jgi:hypothetical protein